MSKTIDNYSQSLISFDLRSDHFEETSPLRFLYHDKFTNAECLIMHSRNFVDSGDILDILGNRLGGAGNFGYFTFTYASANIPSDSPWPNDSTNKLYIESKRLTEYGTQLVFAYLVPGNISSMKIAVRTTMGLEDEYKWRDSSWAFLKS